MYSTVQNAVYNVDYGHVVSRTFCWWGTKAPPQFSTLRRVHSIHYRLIFCWNRLLLCCPLSARCVMHPSERVSSRSVKRLPSSRPSWRNLVLTLMSRRATDPFLTWLSCRRSSSVGLYSLNNCGLISVRVILCRPSSQRTVEVTQLKRRSWKSLPMSSTLQMVRR